MERTQFDTPARKPRTMFPRRSTVGLLLGSALGLVGLQKREAKGKKKKKKDKTTNAPPNCPPSAVSPPPTVCPPPTGCPPVDTCPARTCCDCKETSDTPGCQIGRAKNPGENTADVCDELCGLNLWNFRIGSDPANGQAVGCLANGESCALLDCPLF